MRERQRAEIARNLLSQRGFLSIADLMAATGASAASARRDAGRLAGAGLAERVHGGLQAVDDSFAFGAASARFAILRHVARRQYRRQARHRQARGRHVRGRRRRHRQRRHDDVPDVGILAPDEAENSHQLLPARRISHPRDREPRGAAGRRGLSRPEADRRAVRRRRHPALRRQNHVHERDLDQSTWSHRRRSADRSRGEQVAQARRPGGCARRFLKIPGQRQLGSLPAVARAHAHHRRRRARTGAADVEGRWRQNARRRAREGAPA